jgi:hypothetical protein
MKRILLPLLFSCLAILSVRADLIWYEGFDYADGPIIATSTNLAGTYTNWSRHGGTAAPSDALVVNKKLEVGTSLTGNPLTRQDDVNRVFCTAGGCAYTNGAQILYASFTINFTNLPGANGSYFAHFFGPGATTFQGRIWALTGNPTGTSNVFSALPGTFRVGVSATGGGNPSKIFPVDLATNTTYQIVIGWNPSGAEVDGIASQAGVLWVNPVSSSDVSSGVTSDAGGSAVATGFGFRQATGFSPTAGLNLTVTNLTTATTFNEAATNVWSLTPVAPVIAYAPKGATNFAGDNVLLSGVAAGQSLGNLTYTWLKDGGLYSNPNGNTNTLHFPSALTTDSGEYQLVATTPYGLSATSTVAKLLVNISFAPPTITVQPATNTIGYFGSSATLTLTAVGPGPITYTWLKAGNVVSGPNPTPAYTISGLTALNAGTYVCGVTNANGGVLSSNAVLVVTNAPAVSIAYLRSLVNPDPTSLFQATGTVTTYTNLTSANTSSYYLQDSTAGINIFVTLGSSFRPQQGDVVTFVGFLSTFQGTLELLADANDSATSYTVLSNNLSLLPAPRTIPFNITNNLTFTSTNLEGSIVMLTNVFFGTNAGTTTLAAANTTVIVTNSAGRSFGLLFASQQDDEVRSKLLPEFAYTVVGPLTRNTNNALNAGYQLTITRFTDVVTNALTITNTHVGNSSTLTWAAAPYSYSYSAWAATAVTGPYVLLTNKLRFIDASGTFTDSSAGGTEKYYRLTTP